MGDLIQAMGHAVDLARRLRQLNEKLKNAEMSNLLGDLALELGEIKLRLADVLAENAALKEKVMQLERAETDPCPKCRKRTWGLVESKPSRHMGDMGVVDRTYRCGECGFTETYTGVPGEDGRLRR
jgi:hypothetical protein